MPSFNITVMLVLCIFLSKCQPVSDEHKEAKMAIDSVVQSSKDQKSRPSYGSGDKTEFLKFVKTNELVLDAVVSKDNILYIAVKNNQEVRDGIAIYYCLSAKRKQVEIREVKIVDAADAFLSPDSVRASVVGKAYCN
jgi:hypothetical protein